MADPMADAAGRPALPLRSKDRRSSAPLLAFLLSLGWLALVVSVMAALVRQGHGPADALGLVVVALAILLPVVLIWLTVLLLRTVAALQDQASRMEITLDRLRRGVDTSVASAQAAAFAGGPISPETALALFISRRELQGGAGHGGMPDARSQPDDQRGLALDTPPPSAAPLDAEALIRALDFPRDASDAQGFDLLRRALHDPGAAELIRAAQEVLSGLAAEGIETRDLEPDRARPEVWRAFAQGARGPAVSRLAGVRDRSVLALTGGRMRADPDFREAAHRFLRAFDRRLSSFEPEASDAQLVRLAETRAARAFMILGRVTGIFG